MTDAALPILETPRLRLRPRTPDDLEDCFRLDREPGTIRWVDWPLEFGSWEDTASHRAFIESRIAHPYPPGLGYWVVTEKSAPETFLGWVHLIPESAVGPEIEVGWRLLHVARNKGYATEAARAVLGHGFGTVRVPRVIADMYRDNDASMNVTRKLGFRQSDDPERTNDKFVLWILDRGDWRP